MYRALFTWSVVLSVVSAALPIAINGSHCGRGMIEVRQAGTDANDPEVLSFSQALREEMSGFGGVGFGIMRPGGERGPPV